MDNQDNAESTEDSAIKQQLLADETQHIADILDAARDTAANAMTARRLEKRVAAMKLRAQGKLRTPDNWRPAKVKYQDSLIVAFRSAVVANRQAGRPATIADLSAMFGMPKKTAIHYVYNHALRPTCLPNPNLVAKFFDQFKAAKRDADKAVHGNDIRYKYERAAVYEDINADKDAFIQAISEVENALGRKPKNLSQFMRVASSMELADKWTPERAARLRDIAPRYMEDAA